MKGLETQLNLWRRSIGPIFLLAVIAGFSLLNLINLEAVGLYYDELHQATGSFAYLDGREHPFSRFPVLGVPLFNMSYSGAIKTAIYGLYMQVTGANFSVWSWRIMGIIFMAAGAVGLVMSLCNRVRFIPLLLMLALIFTDISLLLCTRYDWGPVALALAMRMLLIASFVQWQFSKTDSVKWPIYIGLLLGISIFEKLSSLVIIAPVALFFVASDKRLLRDFIALGVAAVIGASVVIYANFYNLIYMDTLFSVTIGGPPPGRSWAGFLNYLWAIIGLGAGSGVKNFILGSSAYIGVVLLEQLLGLFLIALSAALFFRYRSDRIARIGAVLLASYFLVILGIYLLPKGTWVHHWVIVSPFQYVAVALALDVALRFATVDRLGRILRSFMLGALALFLIGRTIGFASLIESYELGESSPTWSRDKTELAELAVQHRDDAVFLAADWGLATQIHCLSNGDLDLVEELFRDYNGPERFAVVQARHPGKAIYLIGPTPPTGVSARKTDAIIQDLNASPLWRNVDVEPEFLRLKTVWVRKYVSIALPP